MKTKELTRAILLALAQTQFDLHERSLIHIRTWRSVGVLLNDGVLAQ